MSKDSKKLIKIEKEIMDNKYTMLEDSFSEIDSFSDKKLPKANIYPLVKDKFWKCVFNFKRPEYASYLISSFFDLDYQHVLENLEEVNFVLPLDNAEEAVKVVDFACKVDGVIYAIECNNKPNKYSLRRNMDYLYKIAGTDRKSGKGKNNVYSKIKAININNYSCLNLLKGEQALYHGGIYGDKFVDLGDDFEVHYIFLPYLKKMWYTICEQKDLEEKEKLIKELKDWQKFLLVTLVDDSKELNIILEENELFREYRKEAKNMTADEYKRFRDASIEATENMYRQMAYDAEVRGEARGELRGKTEGITLGEENEKLATAKKMKQCNESIDKIKLYTGLSTEKIKNISI